MDLQGLRITPNCQRADLSASTLCGWEHNLWKKKKTQNTCTNHTIKLFWHLFTTSLLVLLSGYYVWQQQK